MLERAAEIVESYASRITLRQLHYRLVSDPSLGYPNTQVAYSRLSHLTAQARRDGNFPALEDLTRSITEYVSWTSVADFLGEAHHDASAVTEPRAKRRSQSSSPRRRRF